MFCIGCCLRRGIIGLGCGRGYGGDSGRGGGFSSLRCNSSAICCNANRVSSPAAGVGKHLPYELL